VNSGFATAPGATVTISAQNPRRGDSGWRQFLSCMELFGVERDDDDQRAGAGD